MPDRGHEMTDELLKELEKRVREEYEKALADAEKKLADWLKKFTREDEEKRKLLADGQITAKEYKDWRFRHIMMGREWQAMRDTLAEDFHHANEIALGIARGKMPDVYALNMNYGTYDIEHGGEIDTGFQLYNHDAAENLMREEDVQLMPGPSTRKAAEIAANKDLQWNQRHIQSAVLQGILQGESPYEVARRLQTVAQMNYNNAVRYARTMTTAAQNAGRYEAFRRADRLGVDLTIEWQATLDQRTRHDHRLMHGQRTTVDKPFHTPDGFTIMWPADCTSSSSNAPQGEIWNCRCTLLSWVKGFEPGTVTHSPKMGDMTFEEWQQAKPMSKEEQAAWIKAGKPNLDEWANSTIRKMAVNRRSDEEQFERYREVLGDLAPKNFTSFQRMKYNSDADPYTELKREYRVVNQYKVDSGSVTPREILWLDNRTITEKRTQFSSKYKYSGNIAGAYIEGNTDSMFFAHSAISENTSGYRGDSQIVTLKSNRHFEYFDVPRDDGTLRPNTFNDTEAKLFEFFADLYEQTPFSSITMLSERGMCDSCKGVMEQFKELFPDVEITVISNKRVEGAVWKYRWRKRQ